jgi:hypothetical protein
VHLVGFIIKKFVTLHGHMNVKNLRNTIMHSVGKVSWHGVDNARNVHNKLVRSHSCCSCDYVERLRALLHSSLQAAGIAQSLQGLRYRLWDSGFEFRQAQIFFSFPKRPDQIESTVIHSLHHL